MNGVNDVVPGLGGSVRCVGILLLPGLRTLSCLGERIDSSDDFVDPAAAHVDPEGLRELLGLVLFGSGGTA